jgi:hypothetical protein
MFLHILAIFFALLGFHPADSGGQVPIAGAVMQPMDSGGQVPVAPADSGGQVPVK